MVDPPRKRKNTMRYITSDDLIESYSKLYQRGFSYLLSKFTLSSRARTISTFTPWKAQAANYWIIPDVKRRWNTLISGNPDLSYEHYLKHTYLKDKKNLKMLSLGSGISSHEMIFASFDCMEKVECIDLSAPMIQRASEIARQKNLQDKMEFRVDDINRMELPESSYPVILFNSSLHHFKNISKLLDIIKKSLVPGGLLIINEYTGPSRLQFRKEQIRFSNHILRNNIPHKYRRRQATQLIKSHVSGPGYLRMLITDPSEAAESHKILPEIHKRFNVLEEKAIGGDILMLVLKDIAHNFLDANPETRQILKNLFELEDKFIKKYGSDFVFGVYSNG